MKETNKTFNLDIIKKEIDWVYFKFDEIIISSRVRIARNIKGYPFPYNMTYDESKKIEGLIVDAFLSGPFNKIFIIDVSSLNNLEKKLLIEKHLISKEFSENSISNKVIIIPKEKITIMINEEDHLRIQAIYPGLNLKKSWEVVNKIDDYIERKVEYAFLPGIGYLTACPTNVGTGLRASVLVNTPGIKFLKRDRIIFNAIEKIGISVRGFYGEGSLPFGSIYQISSSESTGKTEEDIIKEIESVVKLIKEEEKKCIEEIKRSKNLKDKIYRKVNKILKGKDWNGKFCDLYYLISLACATKILYIEKEMQKKLFFSFISEYEKIIKQLKNYLFYKNEGKILKRTEILNV